jgi:hypothetical protein
VLLGESRFKYGLCCKALLPMCATVCSRSWKSERNPACRSLPTILDVTLFSRDHQPASATICWPGLRAYSRLLQASQCSRMVCRCAQRVPVCSDWVRLRLGQGSRQKAGLQGSSRFRGWWYCAAPRCGARLWLCLGGSLVQMRAAQMQVGWPQASFGQRKWLQETSAGVYKGYSAHTGWR